MENRSKLRLVSPRGSIKSSDAQTPSVITQKTDMEKAYEWFMNEAKSRYDHYKSQRSLFGTVTFSVPISECKPEMVVELLTSNGVTLLDWRNVYHMKGIEGINQTRELIRVELTFDTPEIGVLNMPI